LGGALSASFGGGVGDGDASRRPSRRQSAEPRLPSDRTKARVLPSYGIAV